MFKLRKVLKTISVFLVFNTNLYGSSPSHQLQIYDGSSQKNQKKCFIWFEVNNKKHFDQYLQFKSSWEGVGNLMVTARINNVEMLTQQLVSQNIAIISGFKTSDPFRDKDYYDSTVWAEVAKTARNISKMTGNKPVVLENEGAVKQLLKNGISTIDYNKLFEVIREQQWPEIWFWYAPTGKREPVISMTHEIARAVVNGIPKVHLIEPSSAGFSNSPVNALSANLLKKTLILDPSPVSIIYLDDKHKNFWKLIDTNKALQAALGDTVILYPGFDDLENASKINAAIGNRKCSRNEH
jgi:hypothetical protein